MSTFFTLLPIYLLGNLHCFSMCGPLVFLLSQHRFRLLYFLGRALSFSIVGMLSGLSGEIASHALSQFHLGALTAFAFGSVAFWIGFSELTGYRLFKNSTQNAPLLRMNNYLSKLMLYDRAWPTFLFGIFTVLLPCSQTLIVFSACALSQSACVGLFNGLMLALFTSPSLFFAMKAKKLLVSSKKTHQLALSLTALVVGVLGILRGFAELEWIKHLVLLERYHIVIF